MKNTKHPHKLPKSFYERTDVLQIAKELLGKIVVTDINNRYTSGRIVETEAYVGLVDRASHSFGGRRTVKNEHMYSPAGTAYIYICYGIHHMLNVVTNKEGVPDAVLIRAVEPLKGIDIMLERTGKKSLDHTLTRGPGNVGKALGIFKHYSGLYLFDNQIYLMDDGFSIPGEAIGISKRIGVEGAGEDANLPYRFYVKGNPFVSGIKK
ncbi:MAG: DNA-3-methyladenine glycosylase [Chitinophagaceae bacterium]|nr:DNA-3-methyladenine glycosylase [Chitinophagaceae bacterium]